MRCIEASDSAVAGRISTSVMLLTVTATEIFCLRWLQCSRRSRGSCLAMVGSRIKICLCTNLNVSIFVLTIPACILATENTMAYGYRVLYSAVDVNMCMLHEYIHDFEIDATIFGFLIVVVTSCNDC